MLTTRNLYRPRPVTRVHRDASGAEVRFDVIRVSYETKDEIYDLEVAPDGTEKFYCNGKEVERSGQVYEFIKNHLIEGCL